MPEAEFLDLLQRLAMGLGLGLLIGVERGFRHRYAPEGTRAAGLRTHALIGLLGGVSGALLPVVGALGFAALTLAFAAALIVFKVRESMADNDLSVTGTLAALLLFALAAYAMWGDLRVVAAVGVTIAALLALKEALHAWLDKLTQQEVRSALLILAATAIVLPLLPDRAIDPWGLINPRVLWLLTTLVAGASFAGYAAVRILGGRIGLLAGAAAGALVSSTVVTAELGRRVRAAQSTPATAAAGAALAAAISVARAGLFVAAAAPSALPQVAPALAGAIMGFLAGAWVLGRHEHGAAATDDAGSLHDPLDNPLDLKAVAVFVLFLGAVTIVGRFVTDAFGQAGLMSFAAAAGAVDVDAVSLSASALVRSGLNTALVGQAILVAVLANTLAKGAIATVAGGLSYGRLYLFVAGCAASLGFAVWWFAARGGSQALAWFG